MKLLKDKDIIPLVDRKDPIAKDLPKPTDWYDKDSPIQPSSLDLHIGRIYLPGTKKDDSGGVENPKDQHVLQQGQTAVVVTLEELMLPNNIAGIGFPPARVSIQGILMTNPGHVDPGYEGPMHFTIINMGKENYVLRKGDDIVTMLLFDLSDAAEKDWLERRDGKRASSLSQETLNKLCSDFMDVSSRAEEKAKEQVKKAELRVKLFGVIATIIVVVIGVFSNWIVPTWKKPLNKVQTDIAVLEERLDISNIKDRIKEIEQRQDKFEKQFQNESNAHGVRSENSQTDNAIGSFGSKE